MSARDSVIVETERLVVRPWRPEEADRVLDLYRRPEVAQWLGPTPRPMESRDEAVAAIERWAQLHAGDSRYGVWCIEVRDTGVAAGSVLFKPLPAGPEGETAPEVEVGWHLHPDSWGNGYATEAASAAIGRGFSEGIDEMYAVVQPENTASLAVCRRLGMEPIGRTTRWYGMDVEAFRITAAGG
jgi:RimJ/RimL family protein N-acetyltransferase